MKTLTILSTIFLFSLTAYSQDCPPDKVCISREAAIKALQTDDELKAVKVELKAKDEAIEALKTEINNLRVELAKEVGEKTGREQMIGRLTALVDILVKQVRPKKNAFINIF